MIPGLLMKFMVMDNNGVIIWNWTLIFTLLRKWEEHSSDNNLTKCECPGG
jgi:hypothetical protein